MKHFILLVLTGTMSLSFGYSQVDNYAKNSAKLDELDSIYQQELKMNPNSWEPHLNHANRLAEVTFNARKKAVEYYLKALEIDSINTKVYIDFGNYLLKEGDLESAHYCFNKGLKFNPKSQILFEKILEVDEAIRQREEYWELHNFPEYKKTEMLRDMTYKERTDYDKLFKKTKKGIYSYNELVAVFNSKPENLNEKEMFYLLLGQSQQDYYSPYNYDDEIKMQELSKSDISGAIEFGKSIIKKEALNLLILRELLYCYRKMEDTKKATEIEVKIEKIFAGILYSGNGTCDQPFITLSVQEEYPLCLYLGYDPIRVVNSQFMCSGQTTDKMLVKTDDGKDKYLYFNYSPVLIWAKNKLRK